MRLALAYVRCQAASGTADNAVQNLPLAHAAQWGTLRTARRAADECVLASCAVRVVGRDGFVPLVGQVRGLAALITTVDSHVERPVVPAGGAAHA
jgi:hypothetical protein